MTSSESYAAVILVLPHTLQVCGRNVRGVITDDVSKRQSDWTANNAHSASAGSKNSARHRAYESSDRLLAAVGSRTSPPLPAASAFRQLVGGGDRPLV